MIDLAPLARAGRHAIPFADSGCDPARPLTLHAYRAAAATDESPVVLVQHGMARNGDEYRDFWVPAADRHGLVILATTFSAEAWPGAEAYNNGLLGDGRALSAAGYAVPLRVFAALRAAGLTRRRQAYFFGHSAGGQFGHRMLSTQPHEALEAVTVGNPGWNSLPRLDLAFPEGLGGIGVTEADLLRLLSYPLTILAGDADTETDSPSLPKGPEALRQGPHRYARARHYFEAGQAEAARRGITCAWRLVTVPGVGHDGAAMSRACAGLWFEGRLPEGLGGGPGAL